MTGSSISITQPGVDPWSAGKVVGHLSWASFAVMLSWPEAVAVSVCRRSGSSFTVVGILYRLAVPLSRLALFFQVCRGCLGRSWVRICTRNLPLAIQYRAVKAVFASATFGMVSGSLYQHGSVYCAVREGRRTGLPV